jgi:AraC family transcriptional regulator
LAFEIIADLQQRIDSLAKLQHQSACRYVARAKFLLQERFADALALSELAKGAGCSPSYLSRRFRAEVGVSITEYRALLRLSMAIRRLARDEGVPLSGLANELGFSHHSHMTATFRRHLGQSPAALRQLIQEGVVSARKQPSTSVMDQNS